MKDLYEMQFIPELNLIYSKSKKGLEFNDFVSINQKVKKNIEFALHYNCNKILFDYSEIELKIESNTLYYVSENFHNLFKLPFPIKCAIYYGDKLNFENWEKYKFYIDNYNLNFINGFSNIEDSFVWLELDIVKLNLLKKHV